MKKHQYFGKIITDKWDGFYSSKEINLPYFEQIIKVNLVVYDEDFEPLEDVLSNETLDEYADTLKNFIENIDKLILKIQELAFENYLEIYAKYYEKPFEVIFENSKIQKTENGELHKPLQIDSKEKHFEYMNSILEKIIISNNRTIVIPLCYDIDEEHGIEVKIKSNKVVKIDGIGETTYE